MWAPLIYGAAADFSLNVYSPIATGQLGFPGPVFLAVLLGGFITWPVAVVALLLTDGKKGYSVTLPIAGAVYAIGIGLVFSQGRPLDHPFLGAAPLFVYILGPAAVLALVGRWRGKRIDAWRRYLGWSE
jgi:hypothetical protein